MMKGMRWESAGVVTVPHQSEPTHADSLRSLQPVNQLHCQPVFSRATGVFPQQYGSGKIQRKENKMDTAGKQSDK